MVIMINELLEKPLYAAIIVFFTQVLMLFFRTINIFYTTKRNVFGSIWTNNANAICWLMSMTIGMHSVLNGQWMPIISYLLGGSIGTYIAIKLEEKNERTEA